MNKHEAIKKVEQMREYERFVNESIPKLSVLNILNQLDEPEKVKVPKFVADWYEENKTNLEYNIWDISIIGINKMYHKLKHGLIILATSRYRHLST